MDSVQQLSKQAKIKQTLNYRNGTENWYRFSIAGNLYTDGVKEMADLCQADWLVTDALVMCKSLSQSNDFIVVTFKYNTAISDRTAMVIYSDGDNKVIHKEPIMITDFPLDEFKMFYENNTLYLPSER